MASILVYVFVVKGSCNLNFLGFTWIIDLAADQACVADRLNLK